MRLQVLNVSANRLRKLPGCVAGLRDLEWLFAYKNQLQELPAGVLGGGSPSMHRMGCQSL